MVAQMERVEVMEALVKSLLEQQQCDKPAEVKSNNEIKLRELALEEKRIDVETRRLEIEVHEKAAEREMEIKRMEMELEMKKLEISAMQSGLIYTGNTSHQDLTEDGGETYRDPPPLGRVYPPNWTIHWRGELNVSGKS